MIIIHFFGKRSNFNYEHNQFSYYKNDSFSRAMLYGIELFKKKSGNGTELSSRFQRNILKRMNENNILKFDDSYYCFAKPSKYVGKIRNFENIKKKIYNNNIMENINQVNEMVNNQDDGKKCYKCGLYTMDYTKHMSDHIKEEANIKKIKNEYIKNQNIDIIESNKLHVYVMISGITYFIGHLLHDTKVLCKYDGKWSTCKGIKTSDKACNKILKYSEIENHYRMHEEDKKIRNQLLQQTWQDEQDLILYERLKKRLGK